MVLDVKLSLLNKLGSSGFQRLSKITRLQVVSSLAVRKTERASDWSGETGKVLSATLMTSRFAGMRVIETLMMIPLWHGPTDCFADWSMFYTLPSVIICFA